MIFRLLKRSPLFGSAQRTTVQDEVLLDHESFEEEEPSYDPDRIPCFKGTAVYSQSLFSDADGGFFRKEKAPRANTRRSPSLLRRPCSNRKGDGCKCISRGKCWTKLPEDGNEAKKRKSRVFPGIQFLKRKSVETRRGIRRNAKQPGLDPFARSTTISAASFLMNLFTKKTNREQPSESDDVTKIPSSDEEHNLPAALSKVLGGFTDPSKQGNKLEQAAYGNGDETHIVGMQHTPGRIPGSEDQNHFKDLRQLDEQQKRKTEGGNIFFLNPPPVSEIFHRPQRSLSDVSDISSLSDPNHVPLQFSLENGFASKSSQLIAMSQDIAKSLERVEQQCDKSSSRCLLLLMDPKRRIFEIVQAPYEFGKTTIGDILKMIPCLSTDRRLGKMKYSGISYGGVPVSAPMVPLDIVLESKESGEPVFAVPNGFSSEQIDEMGQSLLGMPPVAQFLKDQQEKLAKANMKTTMSATHRMNPTNTKGLVQVSCLPKDEVPHLFAGNPVNGRQLKTFV